MDRVPQEAAERLDDVDCALVLSLLLLLYDDVVLANSLCLPPVNFSSRHYRSRLFIEPYDYSTLGMFYRREQVVCFLGLRWVVHEGLGFPLMLRPLRHSEFTHFCHLLATSYGMVVRRGLLQTAVGVDFSSFAADGNSCLVRMRSDHWGHSVPTLLATALVYHWGLEWVTPVKAHCLRWWLCLGSSRFATNLMLRS